MGRFFRKIDLTYLSAFVVMLT